MKTVILLALAALAHAKLPVVPRFAHKATTAAALSVRGGGMISADIPIKINIATGVLYGLQCILAPSTMTTQYYSVPSNPVAEHDVRQCHLFSSQRIGHDEADDAVEHWLRGMGVAFAGFAALLSQADPEFAVKVLLATNVLFSSVVVLNSKFKIFGGDVPSPKYPMHIIPEVLCVGMVAICALAL